VTPDAFDIWDDIDSLGPRLNTYVERSKTLKPEAIRLEEALIRGRSSAGRAHALRGCPTARRILADVQEAGLLGSATPKGPVSLRFPTEALDILFPPLFLET